MSNTKTAQNDLLWDVQKLRFTAFPASSEQSINGDLLWKNISKFDLEKKEDIPRTGEQIWFGTNDEQRLSLKVHPVRIDLILEPKEVVLVSPPGLNMLGKLELCVNSFSKIIEQLVTKKNSLPDITRIAFGGLLFRTVSDLETGYKLLSKLLSFPIDSKNTFDFNLQINKPINSGIVKDLRINRLTKWGVLNAKAVMVSNVNPDNIVRFPERWLNQLELDINTDKEHTTAFDFKILTNLFNELVKEGLNIAKNGLPKQ